MKRIIPLFLVFFIQFSCSTSRQFKVTKLGEEPEKYLERAVYVLPETSFRVTIAIEKKTLIPGPYRVYAKKFLDLEETIAQKEIAYTISDVRVESILEPDPLHYYSVNLIKGSLDWDASFRFTSHGLILSPDNVIQEPFSTDIPVGELHFEDIFPQRTVRQNLTEVTDTLYKTVIRDSSFIRIPIITRQLAAKTPEQKAEEVANLIIKIRNKRFRLISGKKGFSGDGGAMAVAVEELRTLEKEYLELFVGKTICQAYTQTFIVTPDTRKTIQETELARFSTTAGFVNPSVTEGQAINFQIEPLGKTGDIEPFFRSYSETPANSYFYRIPDLATIEVKMGQDILYEGRFSVFQLGEVLAYPVYSE